METDTLLYTARERLGIESLNEMQTSILSEELRKKNIVLYAPTGSGKTLAYALRLLTDINQQAHKPMAVIIVPTRELAIQTQDVFRTLASEMKVTCCYGGHSVAEESRSLAVIPEIVIATPGRLLDHFNRGNILLGNVEQVAIDEFDKILELGFIDEMKALSKALSGRQRIILTSATKMRELPHYLYIKDECVIDCNADNAAPRKRMKVWSVQSSSSEKQDILRNLLLYLPQQQGVVFTNRRETADVVHRYLKSHAIDSVLYHGGMDQLAREFALAKFYTRSAMVLVTTDLASRGLDMKEVAHIFHFDLPEKEDAYIHRNGRTARVDANGEVFVLCGDNFAMPAFINIDEEYILGKPANESLKAPMQMLHIKAGRKEKISKGDILGFVSNAAEDVTCNDIGKIFVFDHYSLVGINVEKFEQIFRCLLMKRLKGRKVRVSKIT